MLTRHFNDSRVSDILHRLETGNDRRGKLSLIKELKLLPEKGCSFVKLLTTFRGTIVHDARFLNLDAAVANCEDRVV